MSREGLPGSDDRGGIDERDDQDAGAFTADGAVAIGVAVDGELYLAIGPDASETRVAVALAIGAAHGYRPRVQRSPSGCRIVRFTRGSE